MMYEQQNSAPSSDCEPTSNQCSATYGQCGCPQCQAAATLGPVVSLTSDPAVAAAGTISGNTNIDALLAGNAYRWNANTTVGTAVTLTYSFLTSAPSYYASTANERNGFQAVTAGMQAGIQSALAFYEQVANIHFTYDASGNGQLTFGQCNMGSNSAAYAYYAMAPGSSQLAGDVWYNANYAVNQTQTAGSYGYMTSLHEIGHALGLKHPGNYDAGGGGTAGPYLPSSTDNVKYTVMSYYGGTISLANPQTLQLFDIQAIQYLYGANTSWHSGNDTYSFSTSSPTVMTIWDGGGTDTLDASNQTFAAYLDLNAGNFSSVGVNASGAAARQNIAIAYNVTIENAIGGAGDDTMVGNAANNTLTGGAGNDTINGGGGTNTAVYRGNRSEYTVAQVNGVAMVSDKVTGRDGIDSLANIQYLLFADQTIAVSSLKANTAPTVTASTTSLKVGQTVAVSTLFSATDPDGDTITRYSIQDPAGGGTLNLNGATNLSGSAGYVWVSASDLAKLTYTAAGSERFQIWASDGLQWTTTAATVAVTNGAPTVTASTTSLKVGQTVAVSTLFSAADPDGDTITRYSIQNPAGGGTLNLNGATNLSGSAGYVWVSASDLAKLTYTAAGSERFQIWASDGLQWTTTPATVAVTNGAPTVTASTTSLKVGQTVAVSTLFSAADP
ncbi:M10 family metallopeptidase C-terminal domain-containing protein, partial [Azospirillum brasilense]